MARKKNGYTRVRAIKNNKGSETPGKSKANNCQKTPNKVALAKWSRFYKVEPKNYAKACKEVDKLN